MKLNLFVFSSILLLFFNCQSRNEVEYELSLIPQPNEISLGQGFLKLKKGVNIKGDCMNRDFFWDKMKTKGIKEGRGLSVTFVEDDTILNKEGYSINIDNSGINIHSSHKAGEFYAIVTLSQLIKDAVVPKILIKDEPAFEWRSFMLDEARYFHGKEVVKSLMDEMADLKMNVFHWHLTNDGGWRIEIKKYPLLTEIGSTRDSTQIIDDKGKQYDSEAYDGVKHEGFYTQEDIKEMVAYANNLNIEIMPEICVPGHISAAVASYPWLGTSTTPIKVPSRFAGNISVLNPANPKTIEFVHDVLKEISELFPGNTIHIGGDEVKFNQWKESKEISAYMKEHNLATYFDVQVHFTNNLSNYIENILGKRMMGWNEILGHSIHKWSKDEESAKTELSKNATIDFWKGDPVAFKMAIDRGHKIVNSQHQYTYINYDYKKLPLEKAYNFSPIPSELPKQEGQQVIGLSTHMWGEWSPTKKVLYYQTFPRIAAYAEVGWTSIENKDYDRFLNNIFFLYEKWQKKGIDPAPIDIVTVKK